MYVLALGTGGIKSSVSVFGADQFDDSDPQDSKEKASFFNWWEVGVYYGGVFTCSVLG
ncbi:unnamed protein product [Discosporangium mesarthrocarpum]